MDCDKERSCVLAPHEQVVTCTTGTAVAEDQQGCQCTCHTSQQPEVSWWKVQVLSERWNKKNFPNWGYSLQMERPISFSPEKWYQVHTRPFPVSLRLQCRLAWANGLLCRGSLCLIFFSILRGCFWSGNTGRNTVCRQNREQSVHAIAEGIISRKETPPSDSNWNLLVPWFLEVHVRLKIIWKEAR